VYTGFLIRSAPTSLRDRQLIKQQEPTREYISRFDKTQQSLPSGFSMCTSSSDIKSMPPLASVDLISRLKTTRSCLRQLDPCEDAWILPAALRRTLRRRFSRTPDTTNSTRAFNAMQHNPHRFVVTQLRQFLSRIGKSFCYESVTSPARCANRQKYLFTFRLGFCYFRYI